MGGVAHFTPPIGKEFILKKFLAVFLSVVVLGSVFVLGISAEDRVLELEPGHRSAPSTPVYSLPWSASVNSTLVGFLSDGGYTSDSNYFAFGFPVYMTWGSSTKYISGLYVRNGNVVATDAGFDYIDSRFLVSDDPLFYSWALVTVDLPESSIVVSRQGSFLAFSSELSTSVFSVGSQLLSFVTSSWLTVVALVAFVLVLGFGVIRKLVKGV